MSILFKDGLYLVTDSKLSLGRDLVEVVKESVLGGVDIVQLREKEINVREFIALAKRMKAMLTAYRVPLVINDRVDVALASGADGVHLGQSDMPYAEARALLGADKIIGLSVESMAQVEKAEGFDLDYIALSPIFSTPTKPDTITEWGIESLKEVRKISRHPIVAIGLLNVSNIPSVVEAGADIIAVVSAICSANSPYEAARELKAAIIKSKENSV
jgi:thiamine-phosphate pyrophosphorylase